MSRNWTDPCSCVHIDLSDEMAHTCADYPRCHEFKPPEPQPPYAPGPYREIFGVGPIRGSYDPCPVCGAGRGELVRSYVNGYGESYEEHGGCGHR